MDFKQYIPKVFFQYDFQRIYSGAESEVYFGSDGNRKVVLKHSPAKTGGYYEMEGNIYKEIEKQNINAPRFIFSNAKKNILLISFVEGRELNDDYDLFDRELIWVGVAKDLSLLRNIECCGFGKIKEVLTGGILRGNLSRWSDFFKNTADLIFSIDNNKIINSDEIKFLYNYWTENSSKITLEKGFLVHGDFCMDHIWTNSEQYAGLIDFGDSFIGDSLMDLAYFKLKEINKDHGRKTFDSLYGQYSVLSGDKRSETEKRILINLYMIHWGVNRIMGVSDENMRRKFGEKIKTLIKQL